MILSDILTNVDTIDITGNLNIEIDDIQYDSRKVTSRSLFICIKGFKSDGHEFIQNCIDRGCRAFLIQDSIDNSFYNATFITVKNTRKIMAKLADKFYKSPTNEMKVIGVTGTNGKTSITTFIKQILDENSKCGLVGTIKIHDGKNDIISNNTTPESVDLQKHFRAMRNNLCQYCTMEVSSHSLVLNRVDDVDFNVGIFTNLTPDHLDFHKDLDDYRIAKEMLFYKTKKANIINIDDPAGILIYNNIKNLNTPAYTYSVDNNADFMAKNVILKPEGVYYKVVTPLYEEDIFVPVPGKFTVYNTLAVIACCFMLEIPIGVIKRKLAETKGVPGRFESIKNDLGISVIVDYAHTPDALENVLKTAKEFARGKIITVFGCGGDRDSTKRPMMGKIAQTYSDIAIVTNDNPRTENQDIIINDIVMGMKQDLDGLFIIKDRKEAIYKAIEKAEENDIIMIVGKGHEDYQIIGTEKYHFDDKEIAKEAIEKKYLEASYN